MDRLGVFLFDAALSAALFLTVVVLAMLGCRQPARRIILARVALLASLAIPLLVGFGRLPRLDVIDAFLESRFFPRPLLLGGAPDEPSAQEAPRRASPGPEPRWLPVARQWLPRGLVIADLAGVAAGSAWLLLGLAGAHWLIRQSRPPSSAARALFEELLAGRPGAARTDLRVCPRLAHPVITGLLRSTILIPEELDRPGPDAESLRLGLLHEIAHAERSDHQFSTAASVAQAVWFFIPQAWWLRAQLLMDQEFLADRSAAARYGTASGYASSLVSLAANREPQTQASSNKPSRSLAPASTGRVPSPLVQRILMLLHCPYPIEPRTPRAWSWAFRLLIVFASVAAACLVIRWPRDAQAPPIPADVYGPRTRFKLDQFLAEALRESGDPGVPRAYVLPVALPARYHLVVEVRCDPDALPRTRVAGLPLGSTIVRREGDSHPHDPGSIPQKKKTPRWHQVSIHRDRQQCFVAVDGHSIRASSLPVPPAEWLTIEPPPDSPAEFRNLVVTW